MKFTSIINNFTAGEWSPKMAARTDVEQYAKSSKSLKNTIVQVQGGAFRRAGTQYINPGATQQGYLNAATNFKLFKYKPSFESVSYELVTMSGEPDTAKWFVVNTQTGVTSAINVSASADFDSSILNDNMQACQNGDYLFIVGSQGPPRIFYKDTTGDFYLKCVTADFPTGIPGWRTVPYDNEEAFNSTGYITVTGASLAAGATVTLTGTNYASGREPFTSSMAFGSIPFYIKLSGSGTTGVVRITGFSTSLSVTAYVEAQVPGTSGSIGFGSTTGSSYQLQSWGGTYGWPKTITSHQGRIYYASAGGARSSTIWGTRIGNAFDLMEIPFYQDSFYASFPDDNARPFTLVPSSRESSNIQGISSAKTLTINTDLSEIVAYGSNGALGPNDFNFESSTSFGSEFVQPVRVNNYLTFVQRGGKKIRDIVFSFDESQYKSNDLSFTSDHLVEYGDYIVEIVSGEIGTSLLFARTYLGKLLCCSLDRDYGINAWTPFEIDGIVETISMAPQFTGTTDQLWMIVTRTVQGVSKRYLERLIPIYEGNLLDSTTGIDFPYYSDCWTQSIGTYSPTATTFGGLSYLAGKDVHVFFSGFYVGVHSIDSSGNMSIPIGIASGISRDDVIVGLPYESVIIPSAIEAGSRTGTPVGRMKRVNEVFIKFWNTMTCTYGNPNTNVYYDIQFDPLLSTGGPGGIFFAPNLFTGVKSMTFPAGYTEDYLVEIKTSLPFPMNVLGVSFQGVTYD